MAGEEGGLEPMNGCGDDVLERVVADEEGFRRLDAALGECVGESLEEAGRGFRRTVAVGEDGECGVEEGGGVTEGVEGVVLGV